MGGKEGVWEGGVQGREGVGEECEGREWGVKSEWGVRSVREGIGA